MRGAIGGNGQRPRRRGVTHDVQLQEGNLSAAVGRLPRYGKRISLDIGLEVGNGVGWRKTGSGNDTGRIRGNRLPVFVVGRDENVVIGTRK